MDLHAANPYVEDLGSSLRQGLLTQKGVDICVHPLRWTNPYRPPKDGGAAIQILVGPPVLRLPQVGSSMVTPPPLGPPSFYFIVFKIKSKTVGWG